MLEWISVLARVGLAGTLTLAGATKLVDLGTFRQDLQRLGLPNSAAIALTVPLLELGFALGLLLDAFVRPAALATTLLLGLFTGVLLRARRRDPEATCRCFGSLSVAGSNRSAAVRNAVLLVLALTAATMPTPEGRFRAVLSAVPGDVVVPVAFLALVAIVGVLAETRVRLTRLAERLASVEAAPRHRPMRGAQPESPGLLRGQPAPAFELRDLQDRAWSLSALRSRGATVTLVFVDVACHPCFKLLPKLARWQRALEPAGTMALVAHGPVATLQSWSDRHGLHTILVDLHREVAGRYGVYGTPSAVLVDERGRIGRSLAEGVTQVEALLSLLTESNRPNGEGAPRPLESSAAAGPAVGDSRCLGIGDCIDDLSLRDTKGHPVLFGQSAGVPTLMVFLSHGCIHCEVLLDRMKSSASGTGGIGGRRVVLVFADSAPPDEIAGLPWSTVLDPAFELGRRFGVPGTPAGVLLDGGGVVASEVAAGAAAVAALAGIRVSS